MHARFCERIETALAGLQRRIERARKPIDRGAAGPVLDVDQAASREAKRPADDARRNLHITRYNVRIEFLIV
jgi:hypothetical protein